MPQTAHEAALVGMYVLAAISFGLLTLVSAPYGRHTREGWGPTMNTRTAWIVMESPSAVLFAILFMATVDSPGPVGILLLTAWLYHYVYRAFVYPMQARIRPGHQTPMLIAALAFAFNTLNSFVNAPVASGALYDYPASWLWDPRFVLGAALFVGGLVTNRRADATLRALRKPGESGYKIPHGGAYRLVSCPNYLGELVQWTGWAVATWSWEGLAFAVYTAANLVPRAVQHHRWYLETFPDYPRDRRAILPWLL